MDEKTSRNSIRVVIRNRENVLFDEEITAISSYNEKGLFDVLPLHANFISIIKEALILHKGGKDKQEMKIDGGVLRVHENQVQIYLGLLSHPPETPKEKRYS